MASCTSENFSLYFLSFPLLLITLYLVFYLPHFPHTLSRVLFLNTDSFDFIKQAVELSWVSTFLRKSSSDVLIMYRGANIENATDLNMLKVHCWSLYRVNCREPEASAAAQGSHQVPRLVLFLCHPYCPFCGVGFYHHASCLTSHNQAADSQDLHPQ